jgi:mannose-1-phosphate guanylyltransferase/mannose-6-phosphate isomerase
MKQPATTRLDWGKQLILAVILAGGRGTRFWPLSRENCPKQMLHIVGEDTLLRQTIKRLDGLIPLDNVWIITTESLAQDIRLHLRPLGKDAERIRFIIEPSGRNTAPAIALAAIILNKLSADPVMVVMPSDHIVKDIEKFKDKLRSAVEAAKDGYLVTFGIKPTRPETVYGYIRSGHPFKGSSGMIFHAEGFFEKPDLKTAEAFLREGSFYWNSGIFVWKASKILDEIENYLPSLFRQLKKTDELDDMSSEAFKKIYSSLESISIDHGVMEKSRDVLVIPADFGWYDLGNWTSLGDVLERDGRGNILQGNPIDIGSENCTVIAGERVLATIGLKDMVVIDTADATLVSSKEMVPEVRKVVETLKRNKREEHLVHRTVERPWGSYTVLEKGDRYKIKRIVIHPKARLSLQIHRHRSEHWVVVSGTARVTRGEEVFDVHPNESTSIPIAVQHRLENPGGIPLQIIEIQSGDYVEEDDIERFDDEYGRT